MVSRGWGKRLGVTGWPGGRPRCDIRAESSLALKEIRGRVPGDRWPGPRGVEGHVGPARGLKLMPGGSLLSPWSPFIPEGRAPGARILGRPLRKVPGHRRPRSLGKGRGRSGPPALDLGRSRRQPEAHGLAGRGRPRRF